MIKILSIVVLILFSFEGYAQRTASVKKIVNDSLNPIRSSISASTSTSFHGYSNIFTTTTLTSASSEYIKTAGTITITLPNPNTCVNGSLYKRFFIIKGDLGVTTLTVADHLGASLLVNSNKGSKIEIISDGTNWVQLQ